METTVVCGYDASPESRRALDWAANEAALRLEPLHVVMALNWPEGAHAADEPVSHLPSEREGVAVATRAMEAAVQELNASHHVTVTSTAQPRAAIPMLLEEARHASLLVVGARGIGGFERMLLKRLRLPAPGPAAAPTASGRGTGSRHTAVTSLRKHGGAPGQTGVCKSWTCARTVMRRRPRPVSRPCAASWPRRLGGRETRS